MTEENSNETVEAVETTVAPSLDDIASEFKVEEQINNFVAKPQPQQEVREMHTPDPIADPEGFTRYARQQSDVLRTVNDTVQNLTQKVSEYERQISQQKLDAEVDKAVSRINKKLNVEPLVAEIYLEKEYRTNPSFKKIWDHRHQNNKAFEKALDILADKGVPKFSIKQDPQLTENQLAARKSQKTMANSPKTPESEWDNLSNSEFEARWNQFRRA